MMDGFAVAHSMSPIPDLPLGRACNFVYWYLTREADKDGLEKFRARLWQPPPGYVADARSPWSPENEAKAFSSVRAALGLRPSPTPVPSPTS